MEHKVKLYNSEDVSSAYSNLTKDEKIQTLYDAIDIMQAYNGRTRFLCIAMAMGYNNYEGNHDTYIK